MSHQARPGLVDALTLGAADVRSSDVLPRLLAAARRHLDMEVGFISTFTDGQRVFEYVDADRPGLITPGEGHPLEDTYCQRVVDGRLPQLINDAQRLPAAGELEVTGTVPIGAHLSVPLRLSDGRIYGTFCCFSRTGDPSLNQRDVDLLQMFAEVARKSIEDDVEAATRLTAMQRRIDSALSDESQLTTVFQPIVSLIDGSIRGLEALSRFAGTPQQSPDIWFAEAAALGLGVDLEIRAMRGALATLPTLPPDLYVGVNLSPEAVLSGQVLSVLADLDTERVVIEMTEHAPITDYGLLNRALRPLRDRGARVAVDDAGAGYASLRHILWLQPEYIKLDMSITRGIDRDAARAALATALISFARDVGSSIIAEGVETPEELNTIRSLGAEAAQGYHLGRPAPFGDLPRATRTTAA